MPPQELPQSKFLDSVLLIERWRQGDEGAASLLVRRYFEALIDRVRGHLNEKLQRRFDAEDVVQAACLSFFIGARNGRYVIERSGDLWRVLLSITRHKLLKQIEKHTALRRSVKREEICHDSTAEEFDQEFLQSPDHEQAVYVADTIERLLERLSPLEQQILVLRLDGLTLDEIALAVQRSQRTVRRLMQEIRNVMNILNRGAES